jgi:inosine/xanthosine triphosphate pyrophosphatase family protein
MKEIIYGTSNPAKVTQVRDILEPIGFSIKSLAEFNSQITVEEDGETAEENAIKKAVAYAVELNMPVLSMDVALYFNDLPDDKQPGLHVRRISGKLRPSDQEVLEAYAALAASMGDRIHGYWRYAFALAWPDGRRLSFSHDTARIFVSKPSDTVVEGFPLESLQIDLSTDMYVSEMDTEERADFWRTSIGVPLARFIMDNYPEEA